MEKLLKDRKLYILTPAYNGLLTQEYVHGLIGTRDIVRALGGECVWAASRNIANHVRMRNMLTVQALDDGATDLLMIDSDIDWSPHDVVKMMTCGEPFVGGVPRLNKELNGMPFAFSSAGESLVFDPKTGLMEVDGIPTAFMLVRREVFEKLKEEGLAPEYKDLGKDRLEFFSAEPVDGNFMSEDYALCAKWRKVGGKVFAMPGISLGHVKTVVLEGSLLDYMKEHFQERNVDADEDAERLPED